MQRVYPVEPEKPDVEEATRNERDECEGKKKKERIRKLTEAKGEQWRNESSGGALDSRRKGYQCGRLQCSLPPFPPLSLSPPRHDKNRRQVKRRDGSARLLRRAVQR